MNLSEIAWQRFHNQGLVPPFFEHPVDVVAWNGAVQAQDYAGAKWAIAQRLKEPGTDTALDKAFDSGAILRTHLMRPTWHFVSPGDIGWLLKLTAPRVHAANAYYYRKSELDAAVFQRSNDAIARALEGHNYLTRTELAEVLQHIGISASDLRLTYLVMYAELEGVICSGPRRGKQFTYALLDERVQAGRTLSMDEAFAELCKRYFTSHGPALIKDFAWWSGMTQGDAKEAIELVRPELQREVIGGQEYWAATSQRYPKHTSLSGYLLPNYDEALASFTDYSAAAMPRFANYWNKGEVLLPHYLVIDGWVVGTWKRTLQKKLVKIEIKPFKPLSELEKSALMTAAERFGAFLSLSVTMEPFVG